MRGSPIDLRNRPDQICIVNWRRRAGTEKRERNENSTNFNLMLLDP
jgi:hypothetical protein